LAAAANFGTVRFEKSPCAGRIPLLFLQSG
jgi:hypothetical protein